MSKTWYQNFRGNIFNITIVDIPTSIITSRVSTSRADARMPMVSRFAIVLETYDWCSDSPFHVPDESTPPSYKHAAVSRLL